MSIVLNFFQEFIPPLNVFSQERFLFSALIAVFLGSILHETGHSLATRSIGVRGGGIHLRSLRAKKNYTNWIQRTFAACYPIMQFNVPVPSEDLFFSKSRLARRFVYLAGTFVDIGIPLALFFLMSPDFRISSPIGAGIFTAVVLRALVIPINLIPIGGKIRNDGWRVLNPDERV